MMKGLIISICAATMLLSCEKNGQEYVKQNTHEILYVTADNNSVAADGKSFITLHAYLTPDADNKLVLFKTSGGVFQDSSKNQVSIMAATGGDSLVATTWLISNRQVISVVHCNVSVQGIDTTLTFSFTNAFPDSLHVEAALGSIPKGFNSQVLLTSSFRRKVGHPSAGQSVSFSAVDSTHQKPIGQFLNILPTGTDSTGILKTNFLLKDSTYTGVVWLKASCTGNNSNILSDSTFIYITK